MSVGNKIPQTMSAESGMNNCTFSQTYLKEPRAALDSQVCAYCSSTTDKISQQSADQLLWFHINPVEFDGIRIQAELWNLKPEKEEQP